MNKYIHPFDLSGECSSADASIEQSQVHLEDGGSPPEQESIGVGLTEDRSGGEVLAICALHPV
jgi:hypothetical protein